MSSRRPSTQSSIYSARLSGSPASTPSSTAGRKHKKQKKEKKKSKNEGKYKIKILYVGTKMKDSENRKYYPIGSHDGFLES